jgi:hypothetical protein
MATAFPSDAPEMGVPAAAPTLVAVVAAAIYLSSLVDWYVVLPRISGLLGARPCRPCTGEPPRFPSTWREVTRWWYVHRIAAALVLRFGLSYAVVIAIGPVVDLPVAASVVGGAVVGGLAAYMAAMPKAFMQVGHPTAIVGHTVERRRARRKPLFGLRFFGRMLRVPGRRQRWGQPGPREYVGDVSLESVQVTPVAPYEGATPTGGVEYEKNPVKVPLREVDDYQAADKPFTGCEDGCCGINWYCIENPHCFKSK